MLACAWVCVLKQFQSKNALMLLCVLLRVCDLRILSVIQTVLKITSLIWSDVHSSSGSWLLFNTQGVCRLTECRHIVCCLNRDGIIGEGERAWENEKKKKGTQVKDS